MSTPGDLSSLPPATLRAALDASENRVTREKEKIQGEIRKLQKRLKELEKGEGPPGPEKNVANRSQRRVKRSRDMDSSGEDDEAGDATYSPWPIAKARKVDSGPLSLLRYAHSRDETLVMTGYPAHRAQAVERVESAASGAGALLVGVAPPANAPRLGAT